MLLLMTMRESKHSRASQKSSSPRQQKASGWPLPRELAHFLEKYNSRRGSSIHFLKDWPPTSPYLFLIGNVWAYLDSKMDSKGCKTFTEYKDELQKEVKLMPTSYLKNVFPGMRARLQLCISLEGSRTGH